jgi:hypothetical protein
MTKISFLYILRIEETLYFCAIYILKHLLINILYLGMNNYFLVKIKQHEAFKRL